MSRIPRQFSDANVPRDSQLLSHSGKVLPSYCLVASMFWLRILLTASQTGGGARSQPGDSLTDFLPIDRRELAYRNPHERSCCLKTLHGSSLMSLMLLLQVRGTAGIPDCAFDLLQSASGPDAGKRTEPPPPAQRPAGLPAERPPPGPHALHTMGAPVAFQRETDAPCASAAKMPAPPEH